MQNSRKLNVNVVILATCSRKKNDFIKLCKKTVFHKYFVICDTIALIKDNMIMNYCYLYLFL